MILDAVTCKLNLSRAFQNLLWFPFDLKLIFIMKIIQSVAKFTQPQRDKGKYLIKSDCLELDWDSNTFFFIVHLVHEMILLISLTIILEAKFL